MSGFVLGPIDVLAIHDPCLARMQFEIAGLEPFPDAIKHVFRLSSALAVKHGVVGVPGEPDAGQMPRHPEIERIVQEQIGQDRRHDAALRRALVARLKLPIRALHRRFQPTLDVEQDPGFLTVLAQSRHQEAVIEIVEQPPDVELHHPVLVPATASGDGDRLQRRFPRPIAIGIVVEDRIKPWLEPHLDRRLRDPVGYRRDAQHPHAPGLLRNRHCLYRRRKIAAGTHPIPKLVQVGGELRLEPLDRLRVDPCGSLIGFHMQPGFPDQRLGNVVRFAGHAGFLPVARLISHACQMTPSLRSPAITAVSTLLRTAPSLGGASLLSASLFRLGPFAWHRRRRFPQFNARA